MDTGKEKLIAFWDIAPCSFVVIDERPDDGGSTSETSAYFNKTARRYTPEGSHLHAGPSGGV
jgi:hypothetical protein